jgi:hypothetical protein
MKFLILALGLFLVSCARAPSSPATSLSEQLPQQFSSSEDLPHEPQEETKQDSRKEGVGSGQYVEDVTFDFVLAKGEPALMYFCESGTSFCEETDAALQALYAEENFPLSSYKLDFEDSADVRERFGITSPDTVILLGKDGRAQQILVGASERDLRLLLQY